MTFVGQHVSYKGRNLHTMPNVPNGENVTYIDLSDNPISSFNQFISYQNLRFLCVDNTKIVSFHFAPELPMLEEFTCRGTSLSCLQYLHLMTVMVFGDRMKFVNGVKVDQRTCMLGKAARTEYRKHLIDGFVFLKIDPVKMLNNETRQRKSIFNDLSKLIPKENPRPILRTVSNNVAPSSPNFKSISQDENPRPILRTVSNNVASSRPIFKSISQDENPDQQRTNASKRPLRTRSSNAEEILVSYANASQNMNKTEQKLKSQFNLMSNRILASTVDQRSMAVQQNAIIEAHTHRHKHRSNGESNSDNKSSQQNQEQNRNDKNTKYSNKQVRRSQTQPDPRIQAPSKHNSSYDLKSLSKGEMRSKIPKGSKPPLPPSNQSRKQNRNSLNPTMNYPTATSSSSSSSSSSQDDNQNATPQAIRRRRSTNSSSESNSIQANRHSESMPNLAQYHRTHRHRRNQEENEQEQEDNEQFEFEPEPDKQRHRSRSRQQQQQQEQPQSQQQQEQEQPQSQQQQQDQPEEALNEQPLRRQRQQHQVQQDSTPDADLEQQRHRVRRTPSGDQFIEQNQQPQDHHIRRHASHQPQYEKLNDTGIKRQRSSDQHTEQRSSPIPVPIPIPIPHQSRQHHNYDQITQPQTEQQTPQTEQIQQPEIQDQSNFTTENIQKDQIAPQFIEKEKIEPTIQSEDIIQQQATTNIEQTEAITPNIIQEQNENENESHKENEIEEEEEIETNDQIQTQSQNVIQNVNQDETENANQTENSTETQQQQEQQEEEEQEEKPQPSSSEFSFVGQNQQTQQAAKDEPVASSSLQPPSPTIQNQQQQPRKTVKINIPHDLSAISENSPIFLSVNDDSEDSDYGDILNNLLSEDSGAPARIENPTSVVLELLPEDFSSDDTSRRRRNFVVAPFPTNDNS